MEKGELYVQCSCKVLFRFECKCVLWIYLCVYENGMDCGVRFAVERSSLLLRASMAQFVSFECCGDNVSLKH